MRYSELVDCDLNNGEGARVSLWVSGCPHKCKGCHNMELWKEESGEYRSVFSVLPTINKYVSETYVKGLSVLGGEPLAPYNIDDVLSIIKSVKETYPNKDIWVWTGYKIEDFDNYNELFKHIDVIIDGKYEETLPTKKKWRGSDNQRMFKNINGKFILID